MVEKTNNMKLNVGFFVSVSGRWPREIPEKRKIEFEKWLKTHFNDINLIPADTLITTNEDIAKAIEKFKNKNADILIDVIGAFADDIAVVAMAEKLNIPIVVWAPQDPAFDGRRLMSNSLVAATMNLAALKRFGLACSFLYGDLKQNEPALERMFKVMLTAKKLKNTKMGLLGYRPTGFYSSIFDEIEIRKKFGITAEHVDLSYILKKGEGISEKLIRDDVHKLTSKIKPAPDLPEEYLTNHSRLYYGIMETVKEKQFDVVALKCWPELGVYHYTPCAVLSRMADEGFIIGCEGDVDATITMVIQNYLTNDIPFMCDMIRIDEKKNTGLFWHCGQASQKLMNKTQKPLLINHSLAGQGCVLEMVLKPGPVTVGRVTHTKDGYKLYLLEGEAVPTKKELRGTQVNIKFKAPALNVLKTITDNGIPHHYSIIWHHVQEEMLELCRILDIEPVLVKS